MPAVDDYFFVVIYGVEEIIVGSASQLEAEAVVLVTGHSLLGSPKYGFDGRNAVGIAIEDDVVRDVVNFIQLFC